MKDNLSIFLGIVAFGEVMVHVLFYVISKIIGKTTRDKISLTSILKGILERAFVLISLHLNLVSSIMFLGALKIATRIKDTEDKVSNDFFLIGNLVSVMVAIGYYVLLKDLVG